MAPDALRLLFDLPLLPALLPVAIGAFFDSGVRFDSGIRFDEEAPPNPKPRKTKSVKHQEWFPIRIGNQIVWLQNFKTKLAVHATTLGLDPAEVTAISLDVDNAIYALNDYRGAVDSFPKAAFQRIEDALYNDDMAGTIAWLTFAAPGGAPTAVAYGCLRRVFDYINDTIRKSGTYDTGIGMELGVEAPEEAEPSPTVTAEFELRHTTGGKCEVVWTKGPFDGIKLEFDLPGVGIRPETDLRPNFVLNWMPPGTAPVQIKVRSRYIYKDEEFGNWSLWKPFTLTP